MARARRRSDPPGTGETPENARGGFLVVLLPGFGPEVEEGANSAARGLITAARIDRGPAVRRVLGWLAAAGFPVEVEARRFALTVWPADGWKRPVRGPEQVTALVRDADDFLRVLSDRRPALLVLVSCYLFDALRDPALAARVEAVLGRTVEHARRLTSTRLRVEGERRERALVLALPVPGPNTTPEFERELTEALRLFFTGALEA